MPGNIDRSLRKSGQDRARIDFSVEFQLLRGHQKTLELLVAAPEHLLFPRLAAEYVAGS